MIVFGKVFEITMYLVVWNCLIYTLATVYVMMSSSFIGTEIVS
jgi:hypothetical protein